MRFAFAPSFFRFMTTTLHKTILIICCSLLALQSWSCTEKFMSDPIAIKIYSTPLTPEKTPSLILCLANNIEQYDFRKLDKYGLTYDGYMNEGIWESNFTKAAGLTVEDVLENLVNENFW